MGSKRRMLVWSGFAATAVAVLAWGGSGAPPLAAEEGCAGQVPTVVGSSGPDVLVGTHGRDVILGGAGDDLIRAKGGDDVICGGAGDDIIRAGAGDDEVYGGDGEDTVTFARAAAGVVVDLADGTTAGGDGADRLVGVERALGSPHDDFLVGGAGPEHLYGGRGDDVIEGGGGSDVLAGGPGNDVLVGGPGDDVIVGRRGRDTVAFPDAPGPVRVDLGMTATIIGAGHDTVRQVEEAVGTPFDDFLFGGGADNALFGGPGRDRMRGRAGDDELTGGADRDKGNGGSGADRCDLERPRFCDRPPSGGLLRPDGIGPVRFGDGADEAMAELVEALGDPWADSGWVAADSELGACPGSAARWLDWRGLVVVLVDHELFGYVAAGEPPGLGAHTPAGARLGDTVAELEARYGDRVEVVVNEPRSGLAAHHFFVDRPKRHDTGWTGISGDLSGTGPLDRVTSIRAGGRCAD